MSSKYHTKKGTELPVISLKGKEYLEVKYRLVWFREEHPDWRIETQLVQITEKSCIAKAEIRDASGNLMSTSHKFENAQGFGDFIEKSETGAIGRALALVGYGTQFCGDELDEGSRIVDAPVAVPNPHAAGSHQPAKDDGVQPDAPSCDCGTALKFTSKASQWNPEGSWYCPNFKAPGDHMKPVSPGEYNRWKAELLDIALKQSVISKEPELYDDRHHNY